MRSRWLRLSFGLSRIQYLCNGNKWRPRYNIVVSIKKCLLQSHEEADRNPNSMMERVCRPKKKKYSRLHHYAGLESFWENCPFLIYGFEIDSESTNHLNLMPRRKTTFGTTGGHDPQTTITKPSGPTTHAYNCLHDEALFCYQYDILTPLQ